MSDNLGISVTVSTRIVKFAVGVDPKVGDPFEVIENSQVFTGAEAKAIIDELIVGGEPIVTE